MQPAGQELVIEPNLESTDVVVVGGGCRGSVGSGGYVSLGQHGPGGGCFGFLVTVGGHGICRVLYDLWREGGEVERE